MKVIRNSNTELITLSNDLNNVINCMQTPVVIVDRNLTVRRVTPPAKKIIGIESGDIGRSLSNLNLKIDIPFEMLADAIDNVTIIKKEICDTEGRWFSLLLRPYKTIDNKFDGAVISLLDIDEKKRALTQAEEAKNYAQSIIETVREPLLVLNSDLRVVFANKSFYEIFKVSTKEAKDKLFYKFGNQKLDIPKLKKLLKNVLKKNEAVAGYEITHEFDQIGPRTMLLNARPLFQEATNKRMVLLAIEDISELKKMERVRTELSKQRIIEEEHVKAELRLSRLASFPKLNPNPIFEINLNGEITYLNPSAKKQFPDLMILKTEHQALLDYQQIINKLQSTKIKMINRNVTLGDKYYKQNIFKVEGADLFRFYNSDITEMIKAEELLYNQKEFTENLIDCSLEGIVAVDKSLHCTVWNKAMEKMIGIKAGEVLGKNIIEKFPFISKINEENIFIDVLKGKTVITKDKPYLVPKTGRQGYFEGSYSPLKNSSDEITGVLAIIHEITERKKVDQQIKETAKFSAALAEIETIIHSTLSFEAILDKVLDKAVHTITCEAAGINLRKDNSWERTAVYGLSKKLLGKRINDAHNKSATIVAMTKKPAIFNDFLNDKRVDKEIAKKYGVRSSMVFPLIVKSEVAGVIFFNYHSAPTSFNDNQIDFAAKLSYSLSLAYENAKLYENVHRISETLQRSLLSLDIPKIKGLEIKYFYQSASIGAEVGGDFYDIFKIPNNGYGIIIGDVSGKGIEAAAETAKVRYLLRDRAYAGFSPSKTMADVNNALVRQITAITPKNTNTIFTALTYCTYKPEESTLTISNAANPYPYLVAEDRFIETTGVPVSILKNEQYNSIEVKLNKGDVVIFYTDGLVEARYNKKLFGEEGVRSFVKKNKNLSLNKLIHGLVVEARDFSHDNLTDDVLVIGIKKMQEKKIA